MRRLFPTLGKSKSGTGPMTEVDLLNQSLEEMDRTNAGWDQDARVAACEAALKDGVKEAVLKKVYGEAMVENAKLLSKSNVVDDVVFVEPVDAARSFYLAGKTAARVVGYGHITDAHQDLLKLMRVGAEVEIIPGAGAIHRAVLNGREVLAVGISAIASSLNEKAQ
jgi:hypothetical protein